MLTLIILATIILAVVLMAIIFLGTSGLMVLIVFGDVIVAGIVIWLIFKTISK